MSPEAREPVKGGPAVGAGSGQHRDGVRYSVVRQHTAELGPVEGTETFRVVDRDDDAVDHLTTADEN